MSQERYCQATAVTMSAASQTCRSSRGPYPRHIVALLNTKFETSFAVRPPEQIDVVITVDRTTQLKAIACHASQAADNPVLWRRLELLGDAEHLRYLRKKADAREPAVPA